MFVATQISVVKSGNKSIEKFIKLKTRKLSKNQKLSKSQKLAKSEKKLSKSENLPNFDIKKNGPSFLTLYAKTIFNRLWLAFTKTLIL